jgi:tRNA-dihydrouridine synthase A
MLQNPSPAKSPAPTLGATNTPDRTLSVAPMMGATDRHCRYLLRLISPSTLLYSEMIVTGALLHGTAKAAHFLQHGGDEPAALQLGGSDPMALAECAKMVEQAGYQEVNLNVGCPSDRVQVGGIGACLMREPELVGECVAAMQRSTTIPVTVKCRIGTQFKRDGQIERPEDYEDFKEFIRVVRSAGCRVFIVHARKAILDGLSPKENREIPPLKYEFVYRIKQAFPDCQFLLNGGIKHETDAVALIQKTDGVMLGRAPYSDPFILARIDQQLDGSKTQPADTIAKRAEILLAYTEYMASQISEGVALKHMAKHLLGFYTGQPGARTFRRHLSGHMFHEEAKLDLIAESVTLAGLG